MSVSERVHYRNIESFLGHRVVGQEQAISTVSKVLCTSKLRMNLNPARPKGIFSIYWSNRRRKNRTRESDGAIFIRT